MHAARRSVKLLRATLHLLGPVPPDPRRRAADDALRALAGAMSGTRDLHVAVATVGELVRHCRSKDAPSAKVLKRRLRQIGGIWTDRAGALERARPDGAGLVPALEAIEALVAAMPTSLAPADLAAHAAQAYGRARNSLASSLGHHDPGVVHGARRSLVRHQLQLKLLAGLAGGNKARLARLGRLRELLGRHHDLAFTQILVAETPHPGDAGDHVNTELAALVAARQARLVARAQPLAEMLFARGPRRFRKRLEARLVRAVDRRRG